MPVCSIKRCSARKSKNQPHLTLHRVPKNDVMRRKWLDAVGLQNINPRHKELHICSLHFEESHFNRTLDQIRLRDNAVPTLFNVPSTSNLVSEGSVQEVAATSLPQELLSPGHEMLPISKTVSVFVETENLQEKMMSQECTEYDTVSTSSDTSQNSIIKKKVVPKKEQTEKDPLAPSAGENVCHQCKKLPKLENICEEQKKKIKRLHEKVRRQGKKIEDLEDLIKDLNQQIIINTEQLLLMEEYVGSQDFLNDR